MIKNSPLASLAAFAAAAAAACALIIVLNLAGKVAGEAPAAGEAAAEREARLAFLEVELARLREENADLTLRLDTLHADLDTLVEEAIAKARLQGNFRPGRGDGQGNGRPREGPAGPPGRIIGLRARPVPPDEADNDGAPAIRVLEVVPGHPAARAGLREDDLILDIDGIRLNNPRQLERRLVILAAGGETAVLRVRRGDEEMEIEMAIPVREDREPGGNQKGRKKKGDNARPRANGEEL